MRIIVFVPDELLGAIPQQDRFAWPTDLKTLADSKDWILTNPPLDRLSAIDQACKKRRPRAVFFLPKDKEYRKRIKDLYNHYHKGRRVYPFEKPEQLAKALKLAGKSTSIIRWGALVPMAVLFLAIVGAAVFFRDPILHRASIGGLESFFGAKSHVVEFASTLAPKVDLSHVEVADKQHPMQNLFELETVKAGIEPGPLLSGQFHIDNLVLEGLKFGTPRKESGALSDAPPPEKEEPVEIKPTYEEALQNLMKKLEPPKLDELESVRIARRIESESKERLERLRGVKLPEFNVDALLGGAKADIDGAKQEIAKAEALLAKTSQVKKVDFTDLLKVKGLIDDLRAGLKAVDGAKAKLEAAQKAIGDAKNFASEKFELGPVADDIEWLRRQPAALQEAIEKDREELERRYRLEADELLRAAFGDAASQWIVWAIHNYSTIKPYLRKMATKKPAKRHGPDGTTYSFPAEEPRRPKLWIKTLSFSGEFEGFALKGSGRDLCSDPTLIGQDGRLELTATQGGQTITATLTIGQTGDLIVDLTAAGLQSSAARIGLKVKATFHEGLEAVARIDLSELKLIPDKRLPELETLFTSITQLSADVEYKSGAFSVKTDAARQVSEGLNRALAGRVEGAKKAAFEQFESSSGGLRKQIDGALGNLPDVSGLSAKQAAAGQEADALSALLGDQSSRLDGLKTALQAELDRLTKLR